MNDHRKPHEQVMDYIARQREEEVKTAVTSLFRHCSASSNPVLAFSRACSKVGYMARDGVRSNLFYLESALNEQKHALSMQRLGKTADAQEHALDRDRYLHSFSMAVRRELVRPPEPPSTPDLRSRIHRNLEVGQWNRARLDLDDLMRRADIGGPIAALDTYPRSANLRDEQHATLQSRIERCNAVAHMRDTRVANVVPREARGGIASVQDPATYLPARTMMTSPERHVHQDDARRPQTTCAPELQRSRPSILQVPASKDRGLDR